MRLEFGPQNFHAVRRLNSQAYSRPANVHDGHDDVAVDDNLFALLASEYDHGATVEWRFA